jgi:hypothetical protein
MLLEYSYDKANKVLVHFKNSELATLDIKTVKERKLDGVTKFVMEYTFISDYPEPKQNLIRKALSESLSERLQLCNIFNQFIENQVLNNVIDFSLKFNAVNVKKCEITYSSSYKQGFKEINLCDELVNCLERLDRIILDMGISEQQTNLYKKEGTGRNKKYAQLTIRDVGNTLRQSLLEE